MINVAPAVSAINSAFTLLGAPMTVRKITSGGTFDPVTGAYTGRTTVDRTFQGVVSGNEQRWVAGALVVDNEYVAYLKAEASIEKPSNGEFLLIDGNEVAIQRVDEYAMSGTNLAYRVVLVR